MGVRIDHARRHHQASGVELDGSGLDHSSHRDDPTVPDPDIRLSTRPPAAIEERAGSNDVVEHGTSGPAPPGSSRRGQNLTTRQLIPGVRRCTLSPGRTQKGWVAPKGYAAFAGAGCTTRI